MVGKDVKIIQWLNSNVILLLLAFISQGKLAHYSLQHFDSASSHRQ